MTHVENFRVFLTAMVQPWRHPLIYDKNHSSADQKALRLVQLLAGRHLDLLSLASKVEVLAKYTSRRRSISPRGRNRELFPRSIKLRLRAGKSSVTESPTNGACHHSDRAGRSLAGRRCTRAEQHVHFSMCHIVTINLGHCRQQNNVTSE